MIYFQPLRRKMGIFTLLMACLFMIGWLRSIVFQEAFSIPTGAYRFVLVAHPEKLERNNWKPFSAWEYQGFSIGLHACYIAYRNIVIPLTLLAASLLLDKLDESAPIVSSKDD